MSLSYLIFKVIHTMRLSIMKIWMLLIKVSMERPMRYREKIVRKAKLCQKNHRVINLNNQPINQVNVQLLLFNNYHHQCFYHRKTYFVVINILIMDFYFHSETFEKTVKAIPDKLYTDFVPGSIAKYEY